MYKLKEIAGGVCASEGFYADGIAAGLKPNGAKDLAFIYSDGLCDIASVFTTNKMTAAPIRHFETKGEFRTNFILLNAKNANAMTGKAGIADIDEILGEMKLRNPQIVNPLMSSTGVIGVRLPKEKIISASLSFDLSSRNAVAASEAIMTTDTYAKTIAYKVELEDGNSFHIGAMAKGAGMINPAMATMLCFITTDADVDAKTMQLILDEVTPLTFNAASVDGDTSTNDTVLLLSNRKSGAFDHAAFKDALYKIMLHLAKLMVADGEGATKLVTYRVDGAVNNRDAEIAAKALSNSLLVKTALYGEDPNWGRIASTIGASGAMCDEEYLSIWFDDICVYKKGEILFDETTEAQAAEVMKRDAFGITCDLGLQDGSFTAYGCDLGHEYVKINADYRT
ncbi:MAG: bifunctional ornithine acetyltransferase/N-acetylglutamate synthase [Helicobacteraceae bacterium 4484_230]|nr:MAG: bifunctional ornithine acetyltransferase/N-acetylglutamate synthase [Helicobacteraceae bacterium 4484_230]